MGNQEVKTSQEGTESTLEMLCSLTQMSYNSPNAFNVNPFCPSCQTSKREVGSQNDLDRDEAAISMTVDDSNGKYTSEKGIEQKQKHSASLQQNQQQELNQEMGLSNLSKTKQIKKGLNKIEKKPRHRQLSIFNRSESVQRSQNQNINEQNIRDQNNCKSYHKLVKNYLLLNKFGHLIEPYESKYHTRYYFIIALLMIKHHVNANWMSCYQQIVAEELSIQERKIERKQIQINKFQVRLRELEGRKLDCSALLAKKAKLERQIGHIEVIKHQIDNYSLRACAAFFSDNLEESLRILYLKDDPVMRKRSYFQQAVSIVKDIERKIQNQKPAK